MKDVLNILHLNNTGNDKTDKVCNDRYNLLINELVSQNIYNFKIWDGYYNPDNTKEAINSGHLKIIQYAKDNNLCRVVIAEDDVSFVSNGAYDYFISKIPTDFDFFCGLIYNGDVDEDGRIKNGMSGTHTLYCVNSRFYDFILNQPKDVHCDRNLGQFAYMFKYYVIDRFVCIQRGGYSHQLRRQMTYEPYLIGKKLYGID